MRILPLLLPTWFVAGTLVAPLAGQTTSEQADPLRELVDTLSQSQPAPAQDWIDVLVVQPPNTTSDLWLLLGEENQHREQQAYRAVLFDVCARLAAQHGAEPFEPRAWRPRLRIALEVLHHLGTSEQMQQVFDLLQVSEDPEKAAPSGYRLSFDTRALQEALIASLSRDVGCWDVLDRHYAQADFQVARAMLRALGEGDWPVTANALGRWIGQRPSLDAVLLTQIARVLRQPQVQLSEEHRLKVRRMLLQGHDSVRQAAIRTMGFADDVSSIQALITVLSDTNLALHEESLRALHRITAMTIDGHPDRWELWFEEESNWWREEAASTLSAIKRSHPTAIAELLRELGSKRLFRREIAPHILPLLQDQRPEVARMALAALDSLRPPLELVESELGVLLDHRHHQVREDAERVLLHLGADLPHWRRKLQLPAKPAPSPLPRPR